MSAHDTLKIDIPITETMVQFNGEPIKDLTKTAIPPGIKKDEYDKLLEAAEPLYKGVFLAQILEGVKKCDSLKDFGYYRKMSREIYSATLSQADAIKKTPEKVPKFEVNLDWITKVLAQIEKERSEIPQWNTGTYIGQIAEMLDDARIRLEGKIAKATNKAAKE